jgi:hypothetical protein
VDSLSYDNKVRSDAVWDANTGMHATRPDRNVLMPGETLTIPDPEVTWEGGRKTGVTHVFKRTLPTREFKFQLVKGIPVTGYTCTIQIDGVTVTGMPDGDSIKCQIKPNAKVAVITVQYQRGKGGANAPVTTHKYTIDLGYLRPVTENAGKEDRLRNLGYFNSVMPNNAVPSYNEALRLFQTSHGIDPAGATVVDDTKDKFKELAGDAV